MINYLKEIITEGVGFDGSSYGFRKVENSDMVLIPDLETAAIDPFREASTLSFFSHIHLTDDETNTIQPGWKTSCKAG